MPNKYISVAQADTRYEKRLPTMIFTFDENNDEVKFDVWEDSTVLEKEQALHQATLYIDSHDFDGAKKTQGQDNQFPRVGQETTPEEVKVACLDLALFFLKHYHVRKESDSDKTRDMDLGIVQSRKTIGNYSEEFRKGADEEAASIVRPYLKKWLKGRYTLTRWSV